MRAWYTDNGLLEPEYCRRVIARRELPVEDAGSIIDRHEDRKVG